MARRMGGGAWFLAREGGDDGDGGTPRREEAIYFHSAAKGPRWAPGTSRWHPAVDERLSNVPRLPRLTRAGLLGAIGLAAAAAGTHD